MNLRTIFSSRLVILLLTTALTAGLISWDYNQTPGQFEQAVNDTTPRKKNYDRDKKVRDLDDVLAELDAADMNINMEKMKKELAEAMKGFDQEKIKLQIEKAMTQIDLAKIQEEVKASMSKIDFSKMQAELAEAMKSIDMAKIQKEVQESLAKVDWDKMKAELEKVKDIDMKKMEKDMQKLKEEMKELGPKMEKEMKKAKIEIEKAKAEIKEYKAFTDGLESDGLINKKEGYTLKHKDGELFINGNKASQMTYTKYRSFLEKHKQFNIKIKDNEFNFDKD